MAVPFSAEDTIRIHQVAFVNWLGGLLVDYGTAGDLFTVPKKGVPIIRAVATPDNALADVAETLIDNGWVEGATDEEKRQKVANINALPTPFLTIYFDDPVLDPDIRGAAKKFVNVDKTLLYQFPAHYWMGCTVSSFASRKYTDNYIMEWVMSQFGTYGCMDNERLIPVTHNLPAPGTVWNQALRWTGTSDTSELEGDVDLQFRHDYTFSLRLWLMKQPEVIVP